MHGPDRAPHAVGRGDRQIRGTQEFMACASQGNAASMLSHSTFVFGLICHGTRIADTRALGMAFVFFSNASVSNRLNRFARIVFKQRFYTSLIPDTQALIRPVHKAGIVAPHHSLPVESGLVERITK
ncbi:MULTISPECIES: hypothetical protein [Burkholderia]|nr:MULTISPECIES: hypothetical protein [Burkholderia]MBJ9712892.1 hypothetical protein [Burkholderia gladioli]MBU9156674.1 hypothetical protein [Burkholderia gladioli]MBU9170235.1 hypothetical protein [Burkholderia gladioli]MBU9193852.1 hypothetical protein [Burkholderia gladioli]MBU9426495.1 hypothetical protein [Burkholderia gladioli]